jgi:hypothetical protein
MKYNKVWNHCFLHHPNGRHTAIYMQNLSGHPGRLIAEQKLNRMGNVLGLTNSAHGVPFVAGFQFFGVSLSVFPKAAKPSKKAPPHLPEWSAPVQRPTPR